MAVRAEVHKGGFQGRFYPGNLALVDVGLFLFPGAVLDIQVIKPLAVDQGNTQLFTVRCIDQHAFH